MFKGCLLGLKMAVCDHSAIKTIKMESDTLMCPYQDDALALYIVCDNIETRASIEINIEPSLMTSITCNLELQSNKSDWIPFPSFSHTLLCKHRGVLSGAL